MITPTTVCVCVCWILSCLLRKRPVNPLNAELNPIRHLLALAGARHIVHVSRLRINQNRGLQESREAQMCVSVLRNEVGRLLFRADLAQNWARKTANVSLKSFTEGCGKHRMSRVFVNTHPHIYIQKIVGECSGTTVQAKILCSPQREPQKVHETLPPRRL